MPYKAVAGEGDTYNVVNSATEEVKASHQPPDAKEKAERQVRLLNEVESDPGWDNEAELAAAIAIVREDRFEQFARTTLGKHKAKEDPPKDPLIDDDPPKDPPKDPVNPPPPKDDPPKDPKDDPPKGRKSAYWGELLD